MKCLEGWTNGPNTKQKALGQMQTCCPLAIVEFDRPTRFTKDEQLTCMNLWSIARSPLILGADMTQIDAFTLRLLT